VLMRFKPYRLFIEEVKKRGGIDGDLAFYLVQPEKLQEQTKNAWGDAVMRKTIDEPLDDLAALKMADWPFYAVFQKGLLRASAIAWRQFAVVGGSKDSTIKDFLDAWIAFLDELSDRGLLTLKASLSKKDKERVWAGISLNVAAESVRWSDAAVGRIAGMLVLWWYFYATKKSQVGSFLKKISGPKGNESFPKGKDLAAAVGKGLASVVVRSDEEPDKKEIEKRVLNRLKDLILLARNKAALDEEEGPEDEDNGEGAALLEGQDDAAKEAGDGAAEEAK